MSRSTLESLRRRSHVAVAGWLKRDDWPFGRGPWKASDVVRIQQWMAANLLDRPATLDPASAVSHPAAAGDDRATEGGLEQLSISKKADVALKMKRREVLAFGLEVQQGKYHLVEQCQRDRLAAIHEVKQGLLDLADSFPGSPEDKAILRGRVLELLRRFAGAGGGIEPV